MGALLVRMYRMALGSSTSGLPSPQTVDFQGARPEEVLRQPGLNSVILKRIGLEHVLEEIKNILFTYKILSPDDKKSIIKGSHLLDILYSRPDIIGESLWHLSRHGSFSKFPLDATIADAIKAEAEIQELPYKTSAVFVPKENDGKRCSLNIEADEIDCPAESEYFLVNLPPSDFGPIPKTVYNHNSVMRKFANYILQKKAWLYFFGCVGLVLVVGLVLWLAIGPEKSSNTSVTNQANQSSLNSTPSQGADDQLVSKSAPSKNIINLDVSTRVVNKSEINYDSQFVSPHSFVYFINDLYGIRDSHRITCKAKGKITLDISFSHFNITNFSQKCSERVTGLYISGPFPWFRVIQLFNLFPKVEVVRFSGNKFCEELEDQTSLENHSPMSRTVMVSLRTVEYEMLTECQEFYQLFTQIEAPNLRHFVFKNVFLNQINRPLLAQLVRGSNVKSFHDQLNDDDYESDMQLFSKSRLPIEYLQLTILSNDSRTEFSIKSIYNFPNLDELRIKLQFTNASLCVLENRHVLLTDLNTFVTNVPNVRKISFESNCKMGGSNGGWVGHCRDYKAGRNGHLHTVESILDEDCSRYPNR